jgi:hypothetical protein
MGSSSSDDYLANDHLGIINNHKSERAAMGVLTSK